MHHHILRLGLMIFIFLYAHQALAERGDTPTYGQTGNYAVGTMELDIPDENRPLHLTIWYPADAVAGEEPAVAYSLAYIFGVQGFAYRDAAPYSQAGAFPLIVYSHSSGASRVLSLWLTEHLASQGFIVIAADHPGNSISTVGLQGQNFVESFAFRSQDLIREIDFAETLNAEGIFANLIDMERVGIVGYSFGAVSALELAGARFNFEQLESWCNSLTQPEIENACFARDLADDVAKARGYESIPSGDWDSMTDERVDAIALFAPWNMPAMTVQDVSIPSLVVVGTSDTDARPERDAYRLFENLRNNRYLASFQLGGHTLFVDECAPAIIQFGRFEVCTDAVWDLERAHDIVNHLTTSFFLSTLRGDEEARIALEDFETRGVNLAMETRETNPLLEGLTIKRRRQIITR